MSYSLTLVFKNFGLILNHSPSRILMASPYHKTTLSGPTGNDVTLTNGAKVEFWANGASLTGASVRPGDSRIVTMENALDAATPTLRTDLSGKLNADVYVPVGFWEEADPQFKTADMARLYRDEWWTFAYKGRSPHHRQKLTNVAEHHSPLQPELEYEIRIDGTVFETFRGDKNHAIEVVSVDRYPVGHPQYKGALDEFEYLFDLLDVSLPEVRQESKKISPGHGWTRPICPIGQLG